MWSIFDNILENKKFINQTVELCDRYIILMVYVYKNLDNIDTHKVQSIHSTVGQYKHNRTWSALESQHYILSYILFCSQNTYAK